MGKLDQKALRVDVELSVERNPRQASQKERVELTIRSRGPAIRAEAAAEDRLAALDLALAKLDSRLRRALDRRKNHYGTGVGAATGASAGQSGGAGPGGRPGARTAVAGASAADEAASEQEDLPSGVAPDDDGAGQGDSVVPIKMEGDGPLVVRQKFHHAKPISIDQALLEMELVGHDFYLFHDIEEDAPSVVYRRHGYQYGVIRLIENSSAPGLAPESPSAGLGARIPGRRRPEQGAPSSRNASRGTRSAVLRPG
ncbi:MAG: ribosome hibernation-promoting factor, HPF/YfiA family [Streptosporangiaceae bacterium]